MILCSPSNPTGTVYSEQQLAEIGRWALEHGIWIMADEIYEHMVYGVEWNSILKVIPELAGQCVVVNGVAKTFAMTGWRVGWMFGPADVMAAASNFQSHVTSNVCNVAQAAALTAISGDLAAAHTMREAFDRRRMTMVKMLREIQGVICPEPRGAFYVFPSVRGLIGRTIGGVNISSSAQLAEVILEQAEVAVVPGEAFGAPGYVRLSYALSDDDLVEGVGRIQRLIAG
jgi:aspartate/methionine/tyrosine aminotransferase